MNRSSKIHLIDATGYLFRSYYAIRSMASPDGTPTNGVYGMLQTFLRFLRTEAPRHAAAVFDAGPESFRNEIFPEYKANRSEPPEDLVPQFDLALEVTRALGLPVFRQAGFEADDILGTLAEFAKNRGHRVHIYSGDKDLAQLVDDRVHLLDLGRDRLLDTEGVIEKFGVLPEQIPDYMGLVGDAIDNIPGVAGIGATTARKLLGARRTLEDVMADLDYIDELEIRGRKSVRRKLQDSRERAFLSRELATIRRDVPMTLRFEDLEWRGGVKEVAAPLFSSLGFERSIDRVPRWDST